MRSLVIGGGGFLGTRIVQLLAARGDDVCVLGRSRYLHHEQAGIPTIQADVCDADALKAACADVDVVFHTAAIPRLWGSEQEFIDINCGGTANVLGACRAGGVPYLVYTSTPSVVFGDQALTGVDESHPYPERHLAHYPRTKAIAERMVLRANNATMATVALRPHLIWGPGDPHLIPRVIDRARRKKLARVGDGKNLVDITYIDNAAQAHLNAADALADYGSCAGKAYFISQGEPVELWTWINELLEAVGVPPVTRSVSLQKAYRLGAALERIYRLLRLRAEPPMTRFLAKQLAESHYFNIEAARRDMGYEAAVSTAEGVQRLVAWISGKPLPVPGATGTSAEPALKQPERVPAS